MNPHLQGNLLPLSPRQNEVLTFMWAFFKENDTLPTQKIMCDHFGWASKQTAADVIEALRRKGYVEKNAVKKNRFSRMFHAEQEASCGKDSE